MSYLYSTDCTDCTDVVESNNIIEIKKAYFFLQYNNLFDGPVVAKSVVSVAVMGSNPSDTLLFFFLFFFTRKVVCSFAYQHVAN